jgi:hypothetical protein
MIMSKVNKNVIITEEIKPKDFLKTINKSIYFTISRHGMANREFEEEKK